MIWFGNSAKFFVLSFHVYIIIFDRVYPDYNEISLIFNRIYPGYYEISLIFNRIYPGYNELSLIFNSWVSCDVINFSGGQLKIATSSWE